LGSSSDTYQPFTPPLRDANYVTGLNTILMRIEDVCGISRGTLSDSADVARTATELKILKQRSYQSNAEIQAAIEDAIRDVIYVMNVYATLYEITPEGEYEVNFEWDDSIIVDINEEINKRITLMQNGLVSKLENRMWYFGETEVQARQALEKIQQENQQAQEADMLMQAAQFGNRE
jgi:A118 family predicted phage portal protein